MTGNLIVKDRLTCEQGKLFQCLRNGLVKVLMDSGEVREYRAKDLIGTLGSISKNAVPERRALK
jgi:hypothetical protein